MKTTLKRVLSIALALVLLIGALPLQTFAEDGVAPVDIPSPIPVNGGEGGGNDHQCTFNSEWSFNGTHHYHKCSQEGCNQTSDNAPHSSSTGYKNDPSGNQHYQICDTCQQWFNYSGHTNLSAAATCTTPQTCTDCGAIVVAALNHDYATTLTAGTDNHWYACSRCGDQKDPTAHTYTTTVSGDTHHWQTCVCGATTEKIAHADANNAWDTDGTYHWHICSCGKVFDKAEHNWVDGKCGACGTPEPATTTPPATTKYNVYYNVNVDETSKVNNPFGTYEEGTPLSTIVQTLKAMEGSTIKFPGLFETWFAVEGWYVDGIKVTDVDTRPLTRNTVFYAKWYQKYNYEVVLKLYTNGNTNNVVKVIDAFKYVQDDGKLSHTEVTNIAKEYIEPNNNAGLTVYGPFDANGWEQYSLYSNRLTNTEYVTVNRNGTTVVHAMVHNAKIYNSTSSTNKKADSSNPKTGDMIMMPAAVMSVSVSALAVMFYLKKKRTV